MKTILYPGSFDPVTNGHMELIERAAALFDRVIVGVLYNPDKRSGLFDIEKRLEILRLATAQYPNVEAQAFTGLLVDAVKACGADAVLRGIRSSADVESELQMARINREIGGAETLFMASGPEKSHISSSMVRQIASLGGKYEHMVPRAARDALEKALGRGKEGHENGK